MIVKPALLKGAGAAEYLNVSDSWLRQTRMLENGTANGTTATRGPKFIRIGARSIRYRISDLDAWIAEQAEQAEQASIEQTRVKQTLTDANVEALV